MPYWQNTISNSEDKMANKNLIIVKKAGELVHPDYIARAVKEYTTYFGLAASIDGELLVSHARGKKTVDDIVNLQTELQAQSTIMVLGEYDTILDEDMMPYTVNVADNISVAIALEGDFQRSGKVKNSHLNEWHCKEEFFKLKLPKLYRAANAGKELDVNSKDTFGIPNFLEELNDPVTQIDLQNSWDNRGFISIIAKSGPAIQVWNNGNVFQRQYSWGHVSSGLGYEEKAAEPPKKMGLLEELRAKKAAASAVIGEIIEGKTDPVKATASPQTAIADKLKEAQAKKTVLHMPVKTDTAVVVPDEWETVGPAVGTSNTEKKKWWYAQVGYVPEGYKTPACRVRRKKGTTIGENAPKEMLPQPQPVAEVPVSVPEDKPDDKKVDPKTLPDQKPAPENFKDTSPHNVSMQALPILSPKQKLAISNSWMKDAEVLKLLGDDMKALAFEPKRIKEFEENFPHFADQFGLESGTLWLTMEALLKLGETDPKALAQYAFNRQNDYGRVQNQLKNVLTDPSKNIASAM